jgi:hypothetical protein
MGRIYTWPVHHHPVHHHEAQKSIGVALLMSGPPCAGKVTCAYFRGRNENRYRHVATGVVVPLLLAMFGLFDLKQSPTFATFHKVDVFQLVVCGMCLGIALTGFIEFLRAPRST